LDVQFSAITLITGLVFFVGAPGPLSAPALGVNVFLFAVELIWERVGVAGITKESKPHLIVFWALSLLLPAFIIALGCEEVLSGNLFSRAKTGSSLRSLIVVMGVLALLTRVATVASSILLARAFGPEYVELRRILEGDRKAAFSRPSARREAEKAAAKAAATAAKGAADDRDSTLTSVRLAAAGAMAGAVISVNPVADVPKQPNQVSLDFVPPSAETSVREWASKRAI